MAVSSLGNDLTTPAASSITATSDAASADRFLKLLVAQMQNQDPLNPMDNAQVTSQMAQINTVSGIAKLNETVEGLNRQFVQMQALQGAALVGRDVIVPGNKLHIVDGNGQGGFELTSAADAVKVEVLNAGGHVVDTLQLGAQSAGRHSFDWDTSKAGTDTNLTFRITATSGAATLSSVSLMRDKVTAVSTSGDQLTLELERTGSTPYASIKAFN
ncbi:flagellar hook assembly protein FlgD [Piscinibacter sp. XHJ-5]|uniref:flagellar hook assembly protein FlgD n=1 Tax=Piscinibacter sp. XHJ-5 TaxID=3037797 RepID=UPI0024528170|nr:flagellar hook assembly protein FlgD [Piscinibacter sp. XHJ-5]